MGSGQNIPIAGISLAAVTFVALLLLGTDIVIALAVLTVWVGSLLVAAGRPPEPARPKTRPRLTLESINDLIEHSSIPLLITDRNTIALANHAARKMLGPHVVGQDARVALRQPEAISLLGESRQGEAIVRGLVRRGDIWQISRQTIDDRLAMLEFINQTAMPATNCARRWPRFSAMSRPCKRTTGRSKPRSPRSSSASSSARPSGCRRWWAI